jgi:hypothetical protein
MSNNKQQTAVQDFWDKIALKLSYEQIDEFVPLFYQAKEMEKEEQREDMIGLLEWMNEIAKTDPMQLETDKDDIVDMYYNETYGGNNDKV